MVVLPASVPRPSAANRPCSVESLTVRSPDGATCSCPPWDVDPTLCGGIWGRAADNGGVGEEGEGVVTTLQNDHGQEGQGQEGSVGSGGARKLLRGNNSAEQQQQQLLGGRRRRRLLDELRPIDAELRHRYLLAPTSSDGSSLSSSSSTATAAATYYY